MTDPAAAHERSIAVVGMAGRFPRAHDLRQFWANLVGGVESVTFLTEQELAAAGVPPEVIADPTYIRAASLIEGVEEFDAEFFGYTPREAEILDPQQRLFLEHAWHALEDAGCAPARYDGLIGIYAGVGWNTYLLSNLVSHPELFDGGGGFQVFIGNDKDFMPTRVSYKLNLKGPSLIVQTSCSTSLVAVHLACLSLLNFECDLALAGGVAVRVPQHTGYSYLEGGLASPDGHCRAFDEAAAGTIFGSGVGVVVLKRLAEALADGDCIRAVVRGSAINNDGSVKVSYTAPSVEGQAEVIAAAQAVAGVEPGEISYVEAHGTGTSLGDPIEVAALTKVFTEGTSRKGFCGLGSVKTNVGHLDAAAGVAGLLKTVLGLENGVIPPSLNFERPNPRIDFATSPFYVVTEPRPWTRDGAPRRAGVSSFGVGGTNAHVILEEAPDPGPASPSRPWQLLLLSARTPEALDQATGELGRHLERETGVPLSDAAYTLQTGRTVFAQRQAVVARAREEAVEALLGRRPERVLSGLDAGEPGDRPVVFLFPGQGAQHPGMGAGLYREEETFRADVDRCCRLLEPHLGLDLRRLLYPEEGVTPESMERLARTEFAQPALFVTELALARLWMEWGVVPRAMLGHSIGEYVAACLAGVFSLEDALRLVAVRGRLMQSCPPGAMLAVPLGEEELRSLLTGGLALAAVNEPERCVVAGEPWAVAGLEERLTASGIVPRLLVTSHAFHSPMMEPILEAFRDEVRRMRLSPPRIPYVSNLTGELIADREATDPESWVQHLRRTVRFADGVSALLRDPGALFLEVGPGRTLTILARRHPAAPAAIASLPHPQDGEPEGAALLTALGRLWLAGREIDWAGFYARERRRRVPLPGYPFERRRYWIDRAGAPATADTAEPARNAVRTDDPAGWLYLPSWRRTLPPVARWNGTCRRVLVVLDEFGLGEALAGRLQYAGQEVVTARAGEDLALQGGAPDLVVHLAGLTGGLGDGESFEAAQRRGSLGLLHLARELAREESPILLAVVADRLLSVTGSEPLAPGKAPLLGIARVASQELPHLSCRVLDVALPAGANANTLAGVADALMAELAARIESEPASGPCVALRPGERWEESFEPVRVAPPKGWRSLLPEGAAVLLTEGLAGPGLALARSLAREIRPRLALIEAPGAPETARRIAAARELAAAGAEVRVLSADLTREETVREVLAELQRDWGGLDATLHAAAVAEERPLLPLAEAAGEEAWWRSGPAALGALTLDRALAAEGLRPRLALLLSSLAGVLGGLGYAAHAAAGCFLDAFARESRRRGGLPWTAVDLDAWRLGEEGAASSRPGDPILLAMTEGEIVEVVRRAAAAGVERIVVSTTSLKARLERSRAAQSPARSETGGAPARRHQRPRLPTPYAPPETELEERITRLWQFALGFDQLGVHDNFFELGGDSFVAVQVISRLKAELGRDVPVARLYQGLTIRSLATLLAEDDTAAVERRAAQLEERRETMDRRHQFLERRRANKRTQEHEP